MSAVLKETGRARMAGPAFAKRVVQKADQAAGRTAWDLGLTKGQTLPSFEVPKNATYVLLNGFYMAVRAIELGLNLRGETIQTALRRGAGFNVSDRQVLQRRFGLNSIGAKQLWRIATDLNARHNNILLGSNEDALLSNSGD